MDDFLKRYEKLNEDQRIAVDTIDGPLLVIAGPGSGKTELLSVRIANILQKTDALPPSILCLTFTDSAAKNMLSRLSKIIGAAAYEVGIHTFHSFGGEIISRYGDYFFDGQEMKVADDIEVIQILDQIFGNLPYDTPLKIQHHGRHFSDFRAAKETISKLKSAGLTPADFKAFLDSNSHFLGQIATFTSEFWAQINLRKKDAINEFTKYIDFISQTPEVKSSPHHTFDSLRANLLSTLLFAHQEATETGKTSPITAWKNRYLEKDDNDNFILKDQRKLPKNFAFAEIYAKYQDQLQIQGLMDYDDMLMRVAQALRENADLRFSLQEKYQYFLIDEFQDTNGVQMEIVDLLSDSEVSEGNPNLFVVGDDDQSIFKFQGANIANIMKFKHRYPEAQMVVLGTNYRSNSTILDIVRKAIIQGTDRLENHLPELSKDLKCGNLSIPNGEVSTNSFTTQEQEFSWIVQKIAALIASGTPPEDIALISRKHSELIHLAAHFEAANIAVNYENRKNILSQKHIRQLIQVLHFLNDLSYNRLDAANAHLSEILTFDFWQIPRSTLWQISLLAYEKRLPWLEVMRRSDHQILKDLADFFITLKSATQDLTAEQLIDLVVGNHSINISDTLEERPYTSPYKSFYFPASTPESINRDYLELLSNLSFLIKKIRRLTQSLPLTLSRLMELIELHDRYSLAINDPGHLFSRAGGVNLITAHKAKGLEFDTVFVFSCEEQVWHEKSGDRFNMLPSNLPIFPERDNQDDVLRLYYVALSRAKRSLFISFHQEDESGRPLKPLRFLDQPNDEPPFFESNEENNSFISVLEAKTFNLKTLNFNEHERRFLQGKVQNYQLSITHLNDFIDLLHCGPQKFFEKDILRFPTMPALTLSYGNAIHKGLDRFYKVFNKLKILPSLGNLLDYYREALSLQRLNSKDYSLLLAKGNEKLTNYYNFHQQNFLPGDKSEAGFGHDGFTVVDGVPIKGKIDRFRINEHTGEIHVFDYKTGRPLKNFDGYSSDEKIKAFKYKNQLVFYKLLIENSRNFKGKHSVTQGTLEFIDASGAPSSITHEITREDTDNLRALIRAVYARIKALDFKSPDLADPDFADVLEFIAELTQQ